MKVVWCMQVLTVLEDVNTEVATGSYMNSVGCAQVSQPLPTSYSFTELDTSTPLLSICAS